MRTDRTLNSIKMISFAMIGIFFFFITVTINGNTSIPLDHLVSFIKSSFSDYLKYYALLLIILGSIYPFYSGTWKDTTVNLILTLFKILGTIFAFMYVFNVGPAFLFEKDMLPFLFEKLVIPVGMIVPLGAIFLSFLIDYGLLELIGPFIHPFMRKIWKIPGKSAIDAVASFVGSYSIGLLITGKIYKNGGYTLKEAAIIATGFSTVSVTFMIIVAKTLNLMPFWNVYFWTTFIIVFIVTAITARIYPIRNMEHIEAVDKAEKEAFENSGQSKFKFSFEKSLTVCANAGNFFSNIKNNFVDGVLMTMSILASIMSIGTCGLLLAKFTPVFKIVGYIFYPFVYALRIPNGIDFSQALASSLAEMFLPVLMLANSSLEERFIGGIVCISSILFFSASIPCIIATGIPIRIKDLVIIWVERVVLTVLLAAPVTYLLIYFRFLI